MAHLMQDQSEDKVRNVRENHGPACFRIRRRAGVNAILRKESAGRSNAAANEIEALVLCLPVGTH